jgi:hypothetical protein
MIIYATLGLTILNIANKKRDTDTLPSEDGSRKMAQFKRRGKTPLFVAAMVVIAGGLASWVFLTSGKEPPEAANPGLDSSWAESEKVDKFVEGVHVQRVFWVNRS